jgi:hypothetical protein
MKVFVDTNISIDYVCRREPFFLSAKAIFASSYLGKSQIAVSAVLKAIHGVKILNVNNAASDENIDSEQPNDVTIAAMKEAKEGNDAGVVCMDSLERFMSSMN